MDTARPLRLQEGARNRSRNIKRLRLKLSTIRLAGDTIDNMFSTFQLRQDLQKLCLFRMTWSPRRQKQ